MEALLSPFPENTALPTWERPPPFLGSRGTSAGLSHPLTADVLARQSVTESTMRKRRVRQGDTLRVRMIVFLRPQDLDRGTETPYKSGLLPSHDPTRAFTRHSSPRQPFPTLCAHVTTLMRSRAAAYPSQILRNVCCLPGDGQSRAGDRTRG